MKTSFVLTIIAVFVIGGLVFPPSITANKTEKAEFKVFGKCGMCKARIEKAARTDGVISAVWTESTQILRLEYDPMTITLATIHKNIAKVGHDTELEKADDAVYDKLPECCKYERPRHQKDQQKQ